MFLFSISLYAPTASFRLPESHTFQQTLPLPPVTALIGIAGAALGFDFTEAMRLREERGLLCGVWGRHSGSSMDLWKYTKIKSGEIIPAVLTREILTDLKLFIVYAMESKDELDKLRQAFLDPKYALSAGTSDDLAKISKVSTVIEAVPIPLSSLENTVLPGDHGQNYKSDIDFETLALNTTIYAPRVFLLPTSFIFNGHERRVKSREHFTFVDIPVKLKQPVKGFILDEKAVPLL